MGPGAMGARRAVARRPRGRRRSRRGGGGARAVDRCLQLQAPIPESCKRHQRVSYEHCNNDQRERETYTAIRLSSKASGCTPTAMLAARRAAGGVAGGSTPLWIVRGGGSTPLPGGRAAVACTLELGLRPARWKGDQTQPVSAAHRDPVKDVPPASGTCCPHVEALVLHHGA